MTVRGNLSLGGIRVLIVEDDEDTREVLTLGLELQGAHVMTVGTAREAMGAVQEFAPHVILSDIGLPDEDGLTLIRKGAPPVPEQAIAEARKTTEALRSNGRD